MCLSKIEEPRVNGRIKRKVQSAGTYTAGKRAAQRLGKVTATKGQERFRIGKEKSRRELVLPSTKLTVPVGSELVIRVFAGAANRKGTRACGAARNQEAIRRATELVTCEIQELAHNRIDRGRRISKEGVGNRCI